MRGRVIFAPVDGAFPGAHFRRRNAQPISRISLPHDALNGRSGWIGPAAITAVAGTMPSDNPMLDLDILLTEVNCHAIIPDRLSGPGRDRLASICSCCQPARWHYLSGRTGQRRYSESVHIPVRPAHQRPPELQLLLLLHQRCEFPALLQLSGFWSQYSWLRRQCRVPLPAIQPQPHLDHHQLLVNEFRFTYMREGQIDLPASPSHRRRAGVVFVCGRAGRLLQRHFGLLRHVMPVDSRRLGYRTRNSWHHDRPSAQSHGRSLCQYWRRLCHRQRMGRRITSGRKLVHVERQLTWVKANHTMKFGADVRRARFDQTLYYNVSGQFTFNSTTSNSVLYGDNCPGYLLGLDDSYVAGFSTAGERAQHWRLSLCPGQLENQTVAYSELWATLGTGYSSGRCPSSRSNLPPWSELNRLSLSVLTAADQVNLGIAY